MGYGNQEDAGGIARGVIVIVVGGIALGIGQNYLARESGPARGLAWVKKEVVLEDLQAFQSAASPAGGTANAPADDRSPSNGTAPDREAESPQPAPVPVVPPDMNDPMGIRAVPPGDDLPVIPDVGRPLQMQLPAVKKFFDAGAAVIIDARTPEEYAEGHIPGSINLDYDQVITDPERLESFDAQGKPIIIYCGGGTCEVSMNLAFAMVQAGQKRLLVFMGGWPEWQGAGYPVATGSSSGEGVR